MQRRSITVRDCLAAALAVCTMTVVGVAGFAARKGKMPPNLSEILSRMNDAAKNLRTVSASLEYTKVTALVNDKSTETGQLFFRKSKSPEIRIDIKKPENKSILFKKDGAEIFLPKINQVQEYNLAGKSGLVEQFLLLGFGTETGELRKNYDVKYLTEEDLDGDTTAVLELTPLAASVQAQIEKIHLWVSEESWIPVQQKFFQPGGDYFLARYTAVVVNRRLPASTFQIKTPADAKRVKMN
ncbi:MAG: outer membrane lipoprotein carrier protein LolA [Terriglobia bacterium]